MLDKKDRGPTANETRTAELTAAKASIKRKTSAKTGAQPAGLAPAAFTLAEVQSFIEQHHAGKGVRLAGRTAEHIGTIHEAYNRSTYKYPEQVLALLQRWAQNPG